jgi:hypothetical protein
MPTILLDLFEFPKGVPSILLYIILGLPTVISPMLLWMHRFLVYLLLIYS